MYGDNPGAVKRNARVAGRRIVGKTHRYRGKYRALAVSKHYVKTMSKDARRTAVRVTRIPVGGLNAAEIKKTIRMKGYVLIPGSIKKAKGAWGPMQGYAVTRTNQKELKRAKQWPPR
ncbi:hypothetical protein GWI34_18430 [Actinomadura sp. DSM 109109]|nr:hypothetical protein [Actinomadura lepetitiana]